MKMCLPASVIGSGGKLDTGKVSRQAEVAEDWQGYGEMNTHEKIFREGKVA